MRVVLFHPVELPVRGYGGVERVVWWLAKGLAHEGVDVRVAAAAGSQVPAGAQLTPLDSHLDREVVANAVRDKADLVHFMAPPAPETLERLREAGIGAITTVHGNGKTGERFPDATVFLTADHARRHGARAFVYNGIDPDELRFEPSARKKEEFLFLSRTSWRVKNVTGAMDLCEDAGVRLSIAGGARPLGARLRAALNPGRFRWLGTVDGTTKASLLADASALVFPVKWAEPFGLVMVEALMSGTPVLATPMGSVPEILTARTGIQIPLDDREGWRRALREGWRDLDPKSCREHAIEKFHYAKMAVGYLRMYERVLNGEKLNDFENQSNGESPK